MPPKPAASPPEKAEPDSKLPQVWLDEIDDIFEHMHGALATAGDMGNSPPPDNLPVFRTLLIPPDAQNKGVGAYLKRLFHTQSRCDSHTLRIRAEGLRRDRCAGLRGV